MERFWTVAAEVARGPMDDMRPCRLRVPGTGHLVAGTRFIRGFALTTLFFDTTSGFIDDICEATALRDVAALKSPSSIIRKEQLDMALTQFQGRQERRRHVLLLARGYCYLTHVKIGGDKLQALRMKNCTVDVRGEEEKDDDYVIYAVTPCPGGRFDVLCQHLLLAAWKPNEARSRWSGGKTRAEERGP